MLIGVYKDIHPFQAVPKERIDAYVNEAKKQNIDLVFFGIADVNFSTETIVGEVYEEGEWVKRECSFPVLLINEKPTTEKYMIDKVKELKLRSIIPCTTRLIEDKFAIYERMLLEGTFAKYVIPSAKVGNIVTVMTFLHIYKSIILKPIDGRRGEGIFKLSKGDQNDYLLQEHKRKNTMDSHGLTNFVKHLVEQGNYLVQPYMQCRTKEGKPFDFRIHVVRDNRTEWIVLKTFARQGDIDTYLTNVSQGGRSEPALNLLMNEFGEQGQYFYHLLKDTALQLAEHINSFYPFTLNELGLDLGLDIDNNIWMYEVNTIPSLKGAEEERAGYIIGYAKLIGNLIMESRKAGRTQGTDFKIKK